MSDNLNALIIRAYCTLFLVLLSCCSVQAAEQPNIVLIMLDDMGIGELQWYADEADISSRTVDASDTFSTPTIFQLAKEGVRFTNYHAPAPVCSQTRAAILTSRYPQEFNIRDYLKADSGVGLPAGIPTIASLLKNQSGYATAHFGKWHVGNDYPHFLPVHFGFDESLVPDLTSSYKGSTFVDGDDLVGASVIDPDEHSSTILTSRAIQFVESSEAAAQPYFINLWFRAPHKPLDPPANFPGTPTNIKPASNWPKSWSELVAPIPELSDLAYLESHSATADAKKRAMYIATLAWVDYQIGLLVKRIDELDPAGNTLIIITSDNGASVKQYASGSGTIPGQWSPNGALEGGKFDVLDGGLETPMIVRWLSGGLSQGSVINDFTLGYDILPTLMDTSDTVVSGSNFVGVSFNDVLLGQGPLPSRTQLPVWEIKAFSGFWGGTDTITTLDDEQHNYAVWDEALSRKLVISRDNNLALTEKLFDLGVMNADGIEEGDSFNIAPAEAVVVSALENDYRNWRMQVGSVPHEYNFANSSASFDQLCIDVSFPYDVVELEQNEQLWFRGGDFSFQTRIELDGVPSATGVVVAQHPGSWSLELAPGSVADTVAVNLEMFGKETAIMGYPGSAGDLISIGSEIVCAVPCGFNVAFTVLGITAGESSVRLYLDNVPVAEYRGDGSDNLEFSEVYANESSPVLLGNDSSGLSSLEGKLIDPRFFRMSLTPMEVAAVLAEQSAEVCLSNVCHP
jgi:arylsulfatase A-like enzyme